MGFQEVENKQVASVPVRTQPRRITQQNEVKPKCFFDVKMGTIVNSEGDTFRVYSCTVKAQGKDTQTGALIEHNYSWDLRFSNLFRAEDKLPQFLQGMIPPKYPFRNYSTNERNCQKRAQEIKNYFTFLFSHDKVLLSKTYQRSIGLKDDKTSDALFEIGNTKSVEDSMEKLEIIENGEKFYEKSQMYFYNVGPSEMPILSYNNKIKLKMIKNGFRSFRTVIGPEGNDWFNFERSTIVNMNDAFSLNNNNNHPLMVIQREFPLLKIFYSLYRNSPSGIEKWCDIERLPNSDQYVITPVSELCPEVNFDSVWGNFSVTFTSLGQTVVEVKKDLEYFDSVMNIEIYPKIDVILFLSIIYAMDRMNSLHLKNAILA